MDTTKEIARKVSAFLDDNCITRTQVAEKIGVTKQAVSHQLSGERVFSKRIADKYAEAFGLNASYLMTGEGLLLPSEAPAAEGDITIPASVASLYKNMAETNAHLSESVKIQQDTIKMLVEMIKDENRPNKAEKGVG